MNATMTANEALRRMHGPFTPEELADRQRRNEEFDRIFVRPILEPLLERMVEILRKDYPEAFR